MPNTFQFRDNRREINKLFKTSKLKVTLFAPDYTDDDSEDHDFSEEDENYNQSESASSGQHNSDPEDNESNAIAPTDVSNQKHIHESVLNESMKSNMTE